VVPVDGLTAVPGSGEGSEKPSARPPVRLSAGSESPSEIDLRGLRGDEAEAVTIAALDAAILADHPYLRIIHGMGTGVVRETVRKVLAADRRVVKFDFAPRNQGGTGVTIAEFGA
jgi:DNA mismatch repair protein MutS2